MCSSYITPDNICFNERSLNPIVELDVEMEVKSEPESEDGTGGITRNSKTIRDNQRMMRTHSRSNIQSEEVDDEPMIDLGTVCLSQEVVEYAEFENKPALLLLVEQNHHTSSSIKHLKNSTLNHSAGLLPNKQVNLETCGEENKKISKNSITKTLRNVKRKCNDQDKKQDSFNKRILNSAGTDSNLLKQESTGLISQSRCFSPGSTADCCNWSKDKLNNLEHREKLNTNENTCNGLRPNKLRMNGKRRVRNQKMNRHTNHDSLFNQKNLNKFIEIKSKRSDEINNLIEVKVETLTNLEGIVDKLSVPIISNDSSINNTLPKESNQTEDVIKGENFVCTVCNKKFREKSHLATHARAHIDIRNFKCNECGSMFKTKPNLYFHLKTHEEAPFVCEKCNKIFPERRMLVRHIRVVHRYEGNFKCDQCGRQFKSEQKLELHYSIHTGKKPFSCDLCSKSFVYKSTYAAHMKGHKADREFQCELCPAGTTDKGDLRRHCHHFSDTRPWLCTVCGKSYPLKSTLKNHMKAHEPEKPFKCSECGKSFMKKYTYECHMKVHSGEQPQFMCDQCSQSYFNYFALKRHYLKHISERKFVCDVCKRAFWTKDALKVHKRSHESVKLFECTQCSKSFAHKHTLVAHIKNHSDEPQPHTCSLCLKTFVHKYNMTRHKCQSLINPHPPLAPSFVLMAPPKHLDFSTLHIL